MNKRITVEQYVFGALTEFDPERDPMQQRINAPQVDLYARNAKALMDDTDRAIAEAPEELRDSWRSGWLPKTVPSRDDIVINRRALAVAIAAASFAPYPSNPSGLRALRRIYATLGGQE